MLNKYYNNVLPIYFKDGKSYIFFSLDSGFVFQFWTLVCFWIVFQNFILCPLGEQQLLVFQIDQGISAALKDSIILSMTNSVFNGRMETTITPEKGPHDFKRNSTDLWPSYGYFKQKVCNFSVEKANMPEMTAFYVNQVYLNYKDNK